MPRTARASQAGFIDHVLNRGNARSEVFHKPADFADFLQILSAASLRLAMPSLAYCLLPDHFRLVVREAQGGHSALCHLAPGAKSRSLRSVQGGLPRRIG